MDSSKFNFGIVDTRFLARSVGLLNPPSPHSISEEDSLEKALQTLQEHKIGCILVNNKEGHLCGIFTERDVLLKIMLKDVALDTAISELMTEDPHTVDKETPIAYVLQMMSLGGYRHMPILDAERTPVGIVSVKDIVDYIVKSLANSFAD